MTHPGSHSEWTTLDITIKNQPFTPYDSSGSHVTFFYNIRVKGHFGEDWNELYSPDEYPIQDSSSEYKVLSYNLGDESAPTLDTGTKMLEFPAGAQVDFQVEALIGHVNRVVEGPAFVPWRFTGETSGWSNTQTLTITDSTPTTTPNTSPSPSTPQGTTASPNQSGPQTITLLGLDWVQLATLALLGVIAVLLVVVVVFLRKRSVK